MINKLSVLLLFLFSTTSCISFTKHSKVIEENKNLKKEISLCNSYKTEADGFLTKNRRLILEKNLCEKRLIICSRRKVNDR